MIELAQRKGQQKSLLGDQAHHCLDTLKELCTRVSSRSMTTHIFPWYWAITSGSRLGSDS